MDSFIFKEKSSTDFEGIVVNSLPPISKPSKRINKIQIDGKDGDIIEFLGYEAYDKTIEITALQNIDVNSLTNWLNGSGKLILSNEPDKYYEAEIIDQINFDRVFKYEPVKINFHVQPFKYLINEEKVIENITTQMNINVENKGYIESKPIITLYGRGKIDISINNILVFSVTIPDNDEYVTVDCIKEDAYKGLILKNRNMIGEFNNIKLAPGINEITWTGNLTKIEIEPKTRWL